MRKHVSKFLAILFVTVSPSVMAEEINDSDKAFVRNAAQAGLAEVKLGELARKRAADAKVRQFASQMIKDHSKANAELKSLASKKHLPVPSAPNKDQKSAEYKLSALSGASFDTAYVNQMVSDHSKVVSLLEAESKSGESELKQWSARTLPTVRHHLKMATDMASK